MPQPPPIGSSGRESVSVPAAQIKRRSTCRLCDADSLDLVLRLAPTPPVDAFVPRDLLDITQPKYPIDLYTCATCGHAQLLDVVSPELLYGNYIYESSSSPGLTAHFRDYADKMVENIPLQGSSFVIDVGSNDGTFLRFFASKDIRVLGIDPAERIARQATDSGIETVAAFLTPALAEQVRREYGAADLVTANNVFAHSDYLGSMAHSVRLLLAPEGIYVFEVSYLLDTVEGMVFDFIYHEHLCYHSIKPLPPFLARHGLELFDVQRVPTKGGSIRCFAQLAGGPRTVSPTVQNLVEREEAAGLYELDTYGKWERRIAKNREDFLELIDRVGGKGSPLAGYGASATTTVLTYHYGIGDRLEVIVDDNCERQGLFSPGFHIPVVGPEWIYERRPEYVVVLAWRFSDAIVAQHAPYLDGGGQFIVPLPELTVL